jgi:hypothetical protein
MIAISRNSNDYQNESNTRCSGYRDYSAGALGAMFVTKRKEAAHAL